ncbi:hypothetical protein Sjap_005258 [Stephania japonica]|uniref:Uncharacterized protein n=1 Tax=Stephania japonica TaxID=461633 RepID=A0AAP0K4S9_9MAGN
MVVSRITDTLVRDVVAVMEYKGLKLQEAVDWVVKNRRDGQAGMIVVSSEGEVAYGFKGVLLIIKDQSIHFVFGNQALKVVADNSNFDIASVQLKNKLTVLVVEYIDSLLS